MKKKVIIFSFIFFLIDLISKILVNRFITSDVVIIPNFLSFVKLSNSGAAFSLFVGGRFFFILLGFIVIFYIYKYVLDKISMGYEMVSISLMLGGIIGNLFDRIFYGYVTDFISLKIFGYYFSVFNLADSFIVIGALIFVINLIRSERNGIKSKF